jgi:hypothetical protein
MVAAPNTCQSVCPGIHRNLLQTVNPDPHHRSRRGIDCQVQLSIHREVDMFDNPSLEKVFLRALVMERKVVHQLDLLKLESDLPLLVILLLFHHLAHIHSPPHLVMHPNVLSTRPIHTLLLIVMHLRIYAPTKLCLSIFLRLAPLQILKWFPLKSLLK